MPAINIKVAQSDAISGSSSSTRSTVWTPFAAGDLDGSKEHILIWNDIAGGGNSNSVFSTWLVSGSTDIAYHAIEPRTNWTRTGNPQTAIVNFTTAATSEAITVDVQESGGSQIQHSYMDLIAIPIEDLGADDYRYNEDAVSRTINAAAWDGGATVTLPATGGDDWIVWYESHILENSTNTECLTGLAVGGTLQTLSQSQQEAEDFASEQRLGGCWIVKAAASNLTLEVQNHALNNANCEVSSSRVFAMRLNAFRNYDAKISTNTAVPTAADLDYLIDTNWSFSHGAVTGDFVGVGSIRSDHIGNNNARMQTAVRSSVDGGTNYTTVVRGTQGNDGSNQVELSSQLDNFETRRSFGWEQSLNSGDTFTINTIAREQADVTPTCTVGHAHIAIFEKFLDSGPPPATSLTVADAETAVESTNPAITPNYSLTVTDAETAVETTNITIGDNYSFTIEDAETAHDVEALSMTYDTTLGVEDAETTVEATSSSVILPGSFPTDPRLLSQYRGTDMMVQDPNGPTSWTEHLTVTKNVGSYVLPLDNSAIQLSKFTSKLNPWVNDYKMDFSLDWSITGAQGTLTAAVVSDTIASNALSACNSWFGVQLRSNGNVRVSAKWAGGTQYDSLNTTPAEVPGRIAVTFRRENWSQGLPVGSMYEIDIYDAAGTSIQNSYSGTLESSAGVKVDWNLFSLPATDITNIGTGQGSLIFKTYNNSSGVDTVTLTDLKLTYQNHESTGPNSYGPVRDGMDLNELPDISTSDQPNLEDGILNPSLPPYSAAADNSADVTEELQDCLDDQMGHSMQVFLPQDARYLVSDTIKGTTLVYRRSNASASNIRQFVNEFLSAQIHGSTKGTRPRITLADSSTGFGDATSANTTKPVILLDSWNPDVIPSSGTKPNSNYNQQLMNVDFNLGNNPGAAAIRIWGAQGCEVYRVRVVGENFKTGMLACSGSGGSVNSLDVVGGETAVTLWTSQPVPSISGCYWSGQTEALVKTEVVGGYYGNRGPAVLTGIGGRNFKGTTAFDFSDTSTTTRGEAHIKDAFVEFKTPNALNTLVGAQRSVTLTNVWVKNCAKILAHPDGDLASPKSTGWIHIKKMVLSDDPPSAGTTSIQVPAPNEVPDPFTFDKAAWIDGVRSSDRLTIEYGEQGQEPPYDLVSRHRIDDNYPTWETATYNVRTDQSVTGDLFTDRLAAIQASIAKCSEGDSVFIPRGYWAVSDTLQIPAGVGLCGIGKTGTHLMQLQFPGADDPFGTNDTPRPILDTTDDDTKYSHLCNLDVWYTKNTPKGYAIRWRCLGQVFGTKQVRKDIYGYDVYPGSGPYTYDQEAPNIQITGKAKGKFYNIHNDNAYSITSDFAIIKVFDTVNRLDFYHLNSEHVDNFPGGTRFENCTGPIFVWGYKTESSYPNIYVKSCSQFYLSGYGGNPSAYIPPATMDALTTDRGTWTDTGPPTYNVHDRVVNTAYPDNYLCISQHVASASTEPGVGASWQTVWEWFPDIGYNIAPAGFPSNRTPSLIVLEDCPNVRIVGLADENRFSGYHPTFGVGTRPDSWHMLTEVTSNTETFVLPAGDRPTLFERGTIVDIYDEEEFTPRKEIGMYCNMQRATDVVGDVPGVMINGMSGIIKNVQWAEIETSKGVYDWTIPRAWLSAVEAEGGRLILKVTEREYAVGDGDPIPSYLDVDDPANAPHSVIAESETFQTIGYTGIRWKPYYAERYLALIEAIGKEFNDEPNFEGVLTTETAHGLNSTQQTANGYDTQTYVDVEKERYDAFALFMPTKSAFPFNNFFSGNDQTIDAVKQAADHSVLRDAVFGGPDIKPGDTSLDNGDYNAPGTYRRLYDMFRYYFGDLGTTCCSIQNVSMEWGQTPWPEADTPPDGAYWTAEELIHYGLNNIGINYIFINNTATRGNSNPDSFIFTDPVVQAAVANTGVRNVTVTDGTNTKTIKRPMRQPPSQARTDVYVDLALGSGGTGVAGDPYGNLSSFAWANNTCLRIRRSSTVHYLGTISTDAIEVPTGTWSNIEISAYGNGTRDPNDATLPVALMGDTLNGGESVILDGSVVSTGWTVSTGNVYSKVTSDDNGVVFEDGVPLTYVHFDTDIATTAAAMSAGTWSYDSATTTTYVWCTDGLDPDTHSMRIAETSRGIDFAITGSLDEFTVRDIRLQGFSRHGFRMRETSNTEISGVHVQDIGGAIGGGTPLGYGILFDANNTDLRIYDCLTEDCFSSGISVGPYGATASVQRDIDISGNTSSGGFLGNVDFSVWAAGNTLENVSVTYNHLKDAGKGWAGNGPTSNSQNHSGIVVQGNNDGVDGVNIFDNIIEGADNSGVTLWRQPTLNVKVGRNFIHNCDKGIQNNNNAVNAKSVEIEHNVVYNNVTAGIEHVDTAGTVPAVIRKNTIDNSGNNINLLNANTTAVPVVNDNISINGTNGINKTGTQTVTPDSNNCFGNTTDFNGVSSTGNLSISPAFTTGYEIDVDSPMFDAGSGYEGWENELDILSRFYTTDDIGAYRALFGTPTPPPQNGVGQDYTTLSIGDGTLSSAAVRHRLNSSGVIESVAINSPRFQYDNVGSIEGILLERGSEHNVLSGTAFEVADGWNNARLSITSTTIPGIISGTDASRVTESTDTNTHQLKREIFALETDCPDNSIICCYAIVKYVDMPYVVISLRDKLNDFPGQRFNIQSGFVHTNYAADTQQSAGIKALPGGWYLIWTSWDVDIGTQIPQIGVNGVSQDGTTNNYTGTGRSYDIAYVGSCEGTYPQFFVPITTTRLDVAADQLTYTDPTIVNDYDGNVTFIGRDATRLLGTPEERYLLSYGSLSVLCTDNDVIVDIGGGNRISTTVIGGILPGVQYSVDWTKSSTTGLWMQVNAITPVSDNSAPFLADQTSGTVYVGSDSTGTLHADVPIVSFNVGTTGTPTNLTVSDAETTHDVTQASMTYVQSATVADVETTHELGQVSMTYTQSVTVADVETIHDVEQTSVTYKVSLGTEGLETTHDLETVAVTPGYVLNLTDVQTTTELDSIAITFNSSLGTVDLETTHDVEQSSITANVNALGTEDLETSHELEQSSIAITGTLLIADLSTIHDLEQASITYDTLLALQDAETTHTLETTDISYQSLIQVVDVETTHDVETTSFTESGNFGLADLETAVETTNPAFTQTASFTIADVESLIETTNPALSPTLSLVVADAETTHEVGSIAVSVAGTFGVEDLETTHDLDQITLSSNWSLSIADAETTHEVTQTQLEAIGLTVADAETVQELTDVSVASNWSLSIADAETTHDLTQTTIALQSSLNIEDLETSVEITSPAMGYTVTLQTSDAETAHSIADTAISVTMNLGVNDAETAHDVEQTTVYSPIQIVFGIFGG